MKALKVSLSDKVNSQAETIKGLEETISSLKGENKTLNEKINFLLNGRKSDTSSTPPSHDIGRSNTKNLRIKSGLKSGGQEGHIGATLEIKAIPDDVVDYKPDYCSACGNNLEGVISVVENSRQEVVIPQIIAKYIEHRSHCRTCPHCQKKCIAALPERLKAAIQYGPSVNVAVTYLSVYQHTPYKRIATQLDDMYGIPISEGTIDNMLESNMQKALPAYKVIQNTLEHSEVVGADETGCHIGGKKGWFHTWQNKTRTFIVASMNRGYATIEKHFPKGFPKSILVSDCWAAQLKTPALLHQICIVHIIRELTNFIAALSCSWCVELKQLFQDAIALKHEMKEEDYTENNAKVAILIQRYDKLLERVADAHKHKKVQALIKRLIKNKASIFNFLYYYNVPADNNGSERAIRPVKVKTKVSGQFRTEKGATRFAVLRSIVDTTIKNGQSVFQALTALANLAPT